MLRLVSWIAGLLARRTPRLFAGPAGEFLISRGDFTQLEQKTLDEILDFAGNPQNHNKELGICINFSGHKYYDRSVGYKKSDITDKMKRCIWIRNNGRFWHNHPSQTSLSHYDWIASSIKQRFEVLAVNESGSIFVGRVPTWRDEFERLFKDKFVGIATDLEFRMDQAAWKATMLVDDIVLLPRICGHVMNLAMCGAGIVHYAAHLSHEDGRLFQRMEAAGVIALGLQYATAEIQSEIKYVKGRHFG